MICQVTIKMNKIVLELEKLFISRLGWSGEELEYIFFYKKLGKKRKRLVVTRLWCASGWVSGASGVTEVKRMVFVFRMIGRKTNGCRIGKRALWANGVVGGKKRPDGLCGKREGGRVGWGRKKERKENKKK